MASDEEDEGFVVQWDVASVLGARVPSGGKQGMVAKPVAVASQVAVEEQIIRFNVVNGKVGWIRLTSRPTDTKTLVFDSDPANLPTESEIAEHCTLPHLRLTAMMLGIPHGSNRAIAAKNILNYCKGTLVSKQAGAAKASGATKTELLGQATKLNITEGKKISGKKSGKTVGLADLSKAELEIEIAKAKAAESEEEEESEDEEQSEDEEEQSEDEDEGEGEEDAEQKVEKKAHEEEASESSCKAAASADVEDALFEGDDVD